MEYEILLWLVGLLIVVIIGLFILLLMQREKKKFPSEESKETRKNYSWGGLPYTKTKIVTDNMFKEAREKLRILDLEREILGYALRRLYERHQAFFWSVHRYESRDRRRYMAGTPSLSLALSLYHCFTKFI